jgi:biotin carboxyl carrier protein
MKHRLRIGDAEHVVEAPARAGEADATVRLDDAPQALRAERLGPDRLALRVDGRRVDVTVASTPAGLWVSAGGRTRRVAEVPATRRRAPGAAGGDVTPPMPAVVLRLLVRAGDAVQARQPLVVVSAMKMELTLVAPHAGVVTALRTEVGAKVSPGDVLVVIAPAATGVPEKGAD